MPKRKRDSSGAAQSPSAPAQEHAYRPGAPESGEAPERRSTHEPHRLCPSCLSNRVHRSRSRGADYLLRAVGLRFYRCHHCKHRFPRFRGWTAFQMKFVVAALALGVVLAAVWFGLAFLDAGRPAE